MRHTISNRLFWKISLSFLLILSLVGFSYVSITAYFSNKYFQETTQVLNAQVANHLIEEKFKNQSPFLEDGSVNKPLFGDIMHNMMAVNRGIEVYLLNKTGDILYSVVLNHEVPEAPKQHVDLGPIHKFLATDGKVFILGDNPRNTNKPKIFSAAAFNHEGVEGFIYIVLTGKEYDLVTNSLEGSYSLKLGLGSMILTLIFALVVGLGAIWYLTANLRKIIDTVVRFKEGDNQARIESPEKTDLSELAITFNQMADKIEENIEQLNNHQKMRQELISNVSHDLRTPIAIINGYAETLLIKDDNLASEDRVQYLKNINSSSLKLTKLVAQLFEYSKLEAKQIEPQKEPFLISELAMDLFYKYKILAEEKEISLSLEVDDNLPLVFADIALVERVIQNLMDNALKFTPKDGDITLILQKTDSNVEVKVRDTGVGISKIDQGEIFERYRKADSSKLNNFGAGLGLAIVKRILDMHQSQMRVISELNKGSEFQFVLPVYNVV